MDSPSPQIKPSVYTSHAWGVYTLNPLCFWAIAPFYLFRLSSFWVLFLTANSLGNPTRWLRVKCERSLNVLKVLSGKSWGGDRTVMPRLYRSLVRSKLDYDCFVHGSATKSKLCYHNSYSQYGNSSCHWRLPYQPSWESTPNLENLPWTYGGIFYCVVMFRSWQLSPITPHMVQFSVPHSATGTN
jgi:hypothetical protein